MTALLENLVGMPTPPMLWELEERLVNRVAAHPKFTHEAAGDFNDIVLEVFSQIRREFGLEGAFE
jgi:hypothetical protein